MIFDREIGKKNVQHLVWCEDIWSIADSKHLRDMIIDNRRYWKVNIPTDMHFFEIRDAVLDFRLEWDWIGSSINHE